MPHSIRGPSPGRIAQSSFKFPGDTKANSRTSMEKFPDLDTSDAFDQYDGQHPRNSNAYPTGGPLSAERWQPRKDDRMRGESWTNGQLNNGRAHGRQKSLTDAFNAIRTRKGSMSANVHEISDALKAPVSPRLIVCEPLLYNIDEC